MNDEDGQDICRVCRSEGSLEEPLFYPCRCTGSIRYVHGDCLEEWLKHSSKETCELCKARFRFTKLYEPSMPKTIPKLLLIKKLILHSLLSVKYTVRTLLAAYVWLGIVPTIIYWHWSGIWHHGSWVAYGLYGGKAKVLELGGLKNGTGNISANGPNAWTTSMLSPPQPIIALTLPLWSPILMSLGNFVQALEHKRDPRQYKDMMAQLALTAGKGQLVVIFVAFTFLVVILLRDWVSHNVPQDILLDLQPEPDPVQEAGPEPVQPRFELQQAAPIIDTQRAEEGAQSSNREHSTSEKEKSDFGLEAISATTSSRNERPEVAAEVAPPMAPAPGRPLPRRDWSSWLGNAANHNGDIADSASVSDEDPSKTPADDETRKGEVGALQDATTEEEFQDTATGRYARQPQEMLEPFVEDGFEPDVVEEDEEDEGAEDLFDMTWRTFLELIGIEGSVFSLIKNAALVTVALGFCLSLEIWAPFVLGKTLMLASPPAVFRIPILCLKLTAKIVAGAVVKTFQASPSVSHETLQTMHKPYAIAHTALRAHLPILEAQKMLSPYLAEVRTALSRISIDGVLAFFRTATAKWYLLARSDSNTSKAVAVLTGIVASSIAAIVAAEQIPARSGSTLRSIRSSLKEYKIASKVALFISIELIAFPLYCGILFDLATLPLFTSDTGHRRLYQLAHFPISALFMHWFVGTAFMFSFAIFVASCREVVRSGVFYWIRDPGDPTFHPVKEIVERSTLSQLHKLFSSGLMYGTIILAGIGTVTSVTRLTWASLLPLRLPKVSIHHDIITFAILDVGIPMIFYWIRPRRLARKVFAQWWRGAAARLRLTSFMFGPRVPSEEGYRRYTTWTSWLWQSQGKSSAETKHSGSKIAKSTEHVSSPDMEFIRDGGFVRVPARDTIPILKKHSMIIRVSEDGMPLTDADRELMHLQDTNKKVDPGWLPDEGNDKKPNFRIVYIPPHFRLRLIAFVLELWLTISFCLVLIGGGSIIIGRMLHFCLWPGRPSHDFESLLLVAPLSLPLALAQDRWAKKMSAKSIFDRIAMTISFLASMAILVACALILLRFYVWYPILSVAGVSQNILEGSLRVIFITEILIAYAVSEILASIAMMDQRIWYHQEIHFFQLCKKAAFGNHFPADYYQRLAKEVVAPAVIGTGTLLIGPLALAFVLDHAYLGRRVYFSICAYTMVGHVLVQSSKHLIGLIRSWLHLVRDQLYLRGKQLRNVDEVDIPESLPLNAVDRGVIHVS